MAQPWYRIVEWTEQDEKRLPSKLKRYKKPFERAQILRIKALMLERSGNPDYAPVIERLLHMVINDEQIQEACSDTGVACELSICHLKLAILYASKGEHDKAEYHFREDQRVSRTFGSGLHFADFLSNFDDEEKLKEADRLLDDVRDAKNPPQLLFHDSKLRYCVARARICHRTGRSHEASEFAQLALNLDGAPGVDAFKRKPMDKPGLDARTRKELQAILRDA